MNIPKKISWKTSLIITAIPFASAIITNLSPLVDENNYFIIFVLLMLMNWLITSAVISYVSKIKILKLDLLPKSDIDSQSGYWKILYGKSNCSNTPFSLLKLMYLDDCESYEAELTDYVFNNTNNKITIEYTRKCRNVFFNSNKEIAKIIFESALLESRHDDFVLDYSMGEKGRLKRVTSQHWGEDVENRENYVKVGLCVGEISRISEADIESAGIRKPEEVKRAYRKGLITPEELIGLLECYYQSASKECFYKKMTANVMLEYSNHDTVENEKNNKKDAINFIVEE